MQLTDSAVRRIAAESWAFRWQVEREAELRFASLEQKLLAVGAPAVLIELASRASADERRHVGLCAELAKGLGASVDPATPLLVPDIAPTYLSDLERLTYEVVAACCIAETESTATLTALLSEDAEERVHLILREIARDEVQHARLGWAYLAWFGQHQAVTFLAPGIPAMLSPGSELFDVARDPSRESPQLVRWGVLPHSRQRERFVSTLREVIFPGLEHLRIDAAPARRWLETRLETLTSAPDLGH